MKRLVFLLVILLSVIFIAHAKNERIGLSATAMSASQKEINAKLNELEARKAELQAKLNWSHQILQRRGLIKD